MKRTKSRLLWPLAALLAILVACGGGGGSTPDGAGSVVVSTFITDDLARDFKQVWVHILKITAVDAAGDEVVLYEPSPAEAADPVNVSQLASVGHLLSQVSVPTGSFRRVKVTLGDTVTLLPRDGSATIVATLGGRGAPVTVSIDVEMEARSPTALVLDFDLQRFTYDPATNRVVATIARRDGRELERLMRRQAELHGTVLAVGADSFVVDDRHLGAGVTVQLMDDAVLFDEDKGVPVELSALKAGTRIEARVIVLPKAQPGDPTVVQAALVRTEDADDEHGAGRLQGRGTVSAIDRTTADGVTRTTLTVELDEANYAPDAGSVKVDVTGAVFSHGTLADLAVGERVDFRGSRSPAGVTAARVRIEGAPSQRGRRAHPDAAFAAGRGVVQSVSGSTFMLAVAGRSHNLPKGTYTVDAAGAMFEAGRLACLAVGRTVEVKGPLDADTTPHPTLAARVVGIEGGCTPA